MALNPDLSVRNVNLKPQVKILKINLKKVEKKEIPLNLKGNEGRMAGETNIEILKT